MCMMMTTLLVQPNPGTTDWGSLGWCLDVGVLIFLRVCLCAGKPVMEGKAVLFKKFAGEHITVQPLHALHAWVLHK